jgi:NAD(P)-dependent dehydrogenase (short-subunit alcohol dehydrogenase family)
MIHLNRRTALITGSSRGIGQQIAIGLARHDCNVLLHGRTLENCDATGKMLDEYDITVHKVAGELDSAENVTAIVNEIRGMNLTVDILYNNAAVMTPWTPITETPLSDWEKSLQVNLFAVIMLCNAFVPEMKERKWGRIINLTSGIKDTPHLAPYGVSKGAIDKYTRELAADCREHNVLVNTLDPGWLKTDLGGPDAMFDVETVLPGALVPALLEDNGPTGRMFSAQDFKYLG